VVNIHTAMTYVSKTLCMKTICITGLIGSLSVTAQAQTPSKAEIEFSSVLEQITNTEISIAHKQAYIATQKAEIESLTKQLADVGDVTASINPMIDKMAGWPSRALRL